MIINNIFTEILFDFSHLPTIEAAAEILDTDIDSVERFLSKKGAIIHQGRYLSSKAINALSEKYIEKIHKYYNKLSANVARLPYTEQASFLQFLTRFAKKGIRHVQNWDDIDISLLIADFNKELFATVHDSKEVSFAEKFISNRKIVNTLLSKLKTLLLLLYIKKEDQLLQNISPDTRDITIVFIESNRFHIFTSDAEESGYNLYPQYQV